MSTRDKREWKIVIRLLIAILPTIFKAFFLWYERSRRRGKAGGGVGWGEGFSKQLYLKVTLHFTKFYYDCLDTLLDCAPTRSKTRKIIQTVSIWSESFAVKYLTQKERPVEWYELATIESRSYETLHNEVHRITNEIPQPGQSYSKMHGTEPRFNEILVITNTIQKTKCLLYHGITKKCEHVTKKTDNFSLSHARVMLINSPSHFITELQIHHIY